MLAPLVLVLAASLLIWQRSLLMGAIFLAVGAGLDAVDGGLARAHALRSAGIDTVKLDDKLPMLGALLKREHDLQTFSEHVSGGRRYRA